MNSYNIFNDAEISWVLFCNNDAIEFCPNVGLGIANVLAEVRAVFVNLFGTELVNSHQTLSVVAGHDVPITFRRHHLIFLSSKGPFYLQHIYQFAHELCHFMVPSDVCKMYRWFEEMLCEAMSWYTLLQISEFGKTKPIWALDRLYSKMQNYVEGQQNERIKVDKPVSDFVAKHLPHLNEECYDRAMNSGIAYEIFPLFQEHHELWKIVPKLHLLTDDMPLSDALHWLSLTADVAESGGNQLIERLTK